MCSPVCKDCSGSAENCSSCAKNRINPPFCTCPEGTAEDLNGNCMSFDASKIDDAEYQHSICPEPGSLFYDKESGMVQCLEQMKDCSEQTLDSNFQPYCMVSSCTSNQFYDQLLKKCVNCASNCGTCDLSPSNCLTCAVNRVSAPVCSCPKGYFV